MPTDIRSVPRAAVNAYLEVLRLPLTAAEVAFRHDSDEEIDPWPPALAFDGFAAQVRAAAGEVLGDDVLREQAALQQGRLRRLRQSAELQAEAARRREQADRELEERRRQAARAVDTRVRAAT